MKIELFKGSYEPYGMYRFRISKHWQSRSPLRKARNMNQMNMDLACRARQRTTLSEGELARGLDVSIDEVRSWELGTATPDGHSLVRLNLIVNAPEIAFAPLLDALRRYIETGFESDGLLLDRRFENAMDEIEVHGAA